MNISIVSLADTLVTALPTSPSETVTGKFSKSDSKTYMVNISWGKLKYNYSGNVKWENNVYNAEDNSNTTWTVDGTEGTDDTIIVQNNSDSDVDVNFSYDKNTDNLDSTYIIAKFNGTSTNSSFVLGSEATLTEEAKQKNMKLTLEGYPMGIKPTADLSSVVIGTVEVKITGK